VDANAGHIGTLDVDGILTLATGGELRQGTVTSGSLTDAWPLTGFTGLRIWNESGVGRIAGYNSGSASPQWYAGTDGKLYAGGGKVILDAAGIHVKGTYDFPGYLYFSQITDAYLRGTRTPMVPSGYASLVDLRVYGGSDEQAEISLAAARGGTSSLPAHEAGIKIRAYSDGTKQVYLGGDLCVAGLRSGNYLLHTVSLQDRVGIGTQSPTAKFQIDQETIGHGTVSNAAGGTTVTGVGTQFTDTFRVGDTITIPYLSGQTVAITAIASDTSMTTAAITNANTNAAYGLTGGNRLKVFGNGNIQYTGNFRPVRSGTAHTGYVFVPLTTMAQHASYDGDAINVGTYTLNLQDADWGLPAGIKAVAVRMSVKWGAAADGNYALLHPKGGSYGGVVCRAHVANIYCDSSGIVPCDAADGDIDLVIGGANATAVFIEVWGYFI
jgi:hypothetical protein